MPGPGMPSWAATPFSKSWRLLSVGSHTMRAEVERDLHRGRVHAADLAVAADPAEHGDRAADVTLHRPRQRCGGGVVRLQHDGPVTGGGRLARGLEGVDRPRAVRIGPEMAVQVGRSGEVDAHRRERRRSPYRI